MYNQFTEIDQRPLPMKKVMLDPMEIPKPGKRKKAKPHSKNPYKIKKIKLLGEQAMREKRVDGFELLKLLKFEHPKEIIRADISYKRIIDINPDHLQFFSNLIELNCSQNQIKLQSLKKLPNVETINISHNKIRSFPLQINGFRNLRTLNLSFNYIEFPYIAHLAMMPVLSTLDIGYNELEQLPQDMSNFENLAVLNLSGNRFNSEYKASQFWSTLSTIPSLRELSIGRNRMRGIHTEKLAAGNFSTLQILDFSFNSVENQHNLICARNFTELKKILVTGNPFVINNEYKGLEMEIYARTGAELVIENIEHYYLRQPKKDKCPIKFDRILKVDNDHFQKNRNMLFGIEIPKEEITSESSQEQSPEEEHKEEEEPAMFMTEQVNVITTTKKLSKTPSNKESQKQESGSSMRDSQTSSKKSESSLKYDEFKKVAAELLGGDKQYNKAFDINTAYKALKNVVSRIRNQ